jgi:hypothetical protein
MHVFSLFFSPVRFASVKLAFSPPFLLPGAASPLANIITPLRRITLPSHWVKMSSLPLLHLLITLYLVVSPLKSKLKHWIYTTAICYPSWTVWLISSTAIKRSSISTLATLLTTQLCLYFVSYLTKLKHHVIIALTTVVVPFYCYLMPIIPPHNDTYGDKVDDPLSLFKQLISMWINIKRYFEISQHRVGL